MNIGKVASAKGLGLVGRTPWSAADALVGLCGPAQEASQGAGCVPPPHQSNRVLSFRQMLETLAYLLQPAQNFLSKSVLVGRRPSLQEESASRLENRCLDFVDIAKALPMAYREQLRFGEQLLS